MSQQDSIFARYFDSNISFLKLTGLWVYNPSTKNGRRTAQLLYNSFWFFYLFVFYEPFELFFLYYTLDNLDEFLRALRDIGNHAALAYKAANYFAKRKQLFELIDVLQHGDFNYEIHNDFRPRWIIQAEKKEASKWTSYFWYFCNAICLSMLLNGVFTFIFMSDKQYIIRNGETFYQQKQPVNTVSPFGSGTKLQFIVTFIYTIIALTFYAWMIVALDSLFITLMSCITAHLKILQGAFLTLRPRCVKRLKFKQTSNRSFLRDPQELQNEVQIEMTKCIKHLQTVLRVSEKLESIYNAQTFFQTFISLCEMCFCLYLLSETTGQNIGNEITYLIATGFELLMYCWFGNNITEASIAVSDSLYASDWFSTNLSFRKQLIFTMTRMKRPTYITIGKITPLTFVTFLTMARGAYSFFTFLKQRHGIRN